MERILGIGNALTDVLVILKDDKILQDMGLPKGGMTHIDEDTYLRIQEFFSKTTTSITVGGSAGNMCRAMAHLGMKSAFIGKVGADSIGANYARSLTRVGIEERMIVSETLPSGVCCAFITPGGERTFADYMGASLALAAEELTPQMMRGYDYLYLEGYLVQNHALIERAAILAKEAGLKIVMDVASYNIILSDKDFVRHLIEKYVDVVFANEEEAKALTGKEPEEALHELAQKTEMAVVKIGAHGSLIQQGTAYIRVPAVQVEQVVDTTSAGDHFAAGFLYGLLSGQPMKRCAEIGAVVAAAAIQVVGTEIPENQWEIIRKDITN